MADPTTEQQEASQVASSSGAAASDRVGDGGAEAAQAIQSAAADMIVVEDFAQAIFTSCYIPGICGLAPYTRFRGKVCVDGGLCMPVPYKKKENYKVFLNVLPDTWFFTGTVPKNTY